MPFYYISAGPVIGFVGLLLFSAIFFIELGKYLYRQFCQKCKEIKEQEESISLHLRMQMAETQRIEASQRFTAAQAAVDRYRDEQKRLYFSQPDSPQREPLACYLERTDKEARRIYDAFLNDTPL